MNTFFFFRHNKTNDWSDLMAENKEPIYMKWWAWVIIFLLTAFIVNYNDQPITLYEEQITDMLPNVDIHVVRDENLYAEETETALVIEIIDDEAEDYDTPATFLVGVDIPEGEYFVMTGEDKLGYVLLTRSQNLAVYEIIWQKHFENHTMINLRAGEYLTTKYATLIPIDDAIVPNFENGTLRSGMYRVGKDIPPGVYTLFPHENKVGYLEVATSSHYLDSHTTGRRNFSEPITIALGIGDYFAFMRAEIRK